MLSTLEHVHRTGLRNRCFGAPNRVDAVLNALRIKFPTRDDGYVLLAIDFKGRGNANQSGGHYPIRLVNWFISK